MPRHDMKANTCNDPLCPIHHPETALRQQTEGMMAFEAELKAKLDSMSKDELMAALKRAGFELETSPPAPEDGETPRKCHIGQIKALEQKCASQAAELSKAQAALKDRSKQLTAMHWVWCSGPCGDMTLNKEIIETAIRNTERMIEKFNGQSSNRAWKSLNEWPEKQDALVKAWGELNAALRENSGLKEKLAESEERWEEYKGMEIFSTLNEAVHYWNEKFAKPLAEVAQLQSTLASLRAALEKIIDANWDMDHSDMWSIAKQVLSSHPAPAMVPVEDVKKLMEFVKLQLGQESAELIAEIKIKYPFLK